MMTCKQLIERLSDYMDGNLSPLGRVSLRLHLWICPMCRRYHDQMRTLLEATRDVPRAELPPGYDAVRDTVLRRLGRGGAEPGGRG